MKAPSDVCHFCRGLLQKKNITYSLSLQEEGVTLAWNSVPAKVCNQCGEKFFDESTTTQLLEMVFQLKETSTHKN